MGELKDEFPDLLTVQQAAAARKVSARTIRDWIAAGMDSVRVPGRGKPLHLIRRAALDAFTPRPRGASKGNQHAAKKKGQPKPKKS